MPLRKTRARRGKGSTDRAIQAMLAFIGEGLPWGRDNRYRPNRGPAELEGLITGHFFFVTLCEEDGDLDTKKALYDQIREPFVHAHAHYRPGTRPWAWWEFDRPEPRRSIGRVCVDENHDENCDGSNDNPAGIAGRQ